MVGGLGFKRDHCLQILDFEIVGTVGVDGIELVDGWTFEESHIVLIGGNKSVGVLLRGLLNKFEQRQRFLLAVDNEGAIENLVAAVLRIHLRETEHFTIGEGTAQFLGKTFKICFLVGAERQTLAEVIFVDIFDSYNRVGLAVHSKHA